MKITVAKKSEHRKICRPSSGVASQTDLYILYPRTHDSYSNSSILGLLIAEFHNY